MTGLLHLVPRALVSALGWTLIHFLWQGTILAALLAGALLLLRQRSAQARYVAACLALGLMAVSPIITFSILHYPAGGCVPAAVTASSAQATPSTAPHVPLPPGVALPAQNENLTLPSLRREAATNGLASRSAVVANALPWLVALWLGGILVLSLRLLGGWFQAQRLAHRQTRPLTGPLNARCQELARKLGITRPVTLRESGRVEVPTVIGWLRATILMPVSVLSNLPAEQLEALLAHELAHIRRHDYLINLCQTAIETVLFYHPAVWWVSDRIRAEREHCCDDLAVLALGDRLAYAHALTALEEMRVEFATFTLAANGGDLLARIRRLLGVPSPRTASLWSVTAVLALLAAGMTAGLTLQGVLKPLSAKAAMHRTQALDLAQRVEGIAQEWFGRRREQAVTLRPAPRPQPAPHAECTVTVHALQCPLVTKTATKTSTRSTQATSASQVPCTEETPALVEKVVSPLVKQVVPPVVTVMVKPAELTTRNLPRLALADAPQAPTAAPPQPSPQSAPPRAAPANPQKPDDAADKDDDDDSDTKAERDDDTKDVQENLEAIIRKALKQSERALEQAQQSQTWREDVRKALEEARKVRKEEIEQAMKEARKAREMALQQAQKAIEDAQKQRGLSLQQRDKVLEEVRKALKMQRRALRESQEIRSRDIEKALEATRKIRVEDIEKAMEQAQKARAMALESVRKALREMERRLRDQQMSPPKPGAPAKPSSQAPRPAPPDSGPSSTTFKPCPKETTVQTDLDRGEDG